MSIFGGTSFCKYDRLSRLLHMKLHLSTVIRDLSTNMLSKQVAQVGFITQMCPPIISKCHCEPSFLLSGGVAISCYLEFLQNRGLLRARFVFVRTKSMSSLRSARKRPRKNIINQETEVRVPPTLAVGYSHTRPGMPPP